jgi:hypothetical protein
MIVKNEETTLPKCLGSVKNFVDEIVLIFLDIVKKTYLHTKMQRVF